MRAYLERALRLPLRPFYRERGAAPAFQQTQLNALDEVTFTVRRGEVVGLIGHNGAGKSVLLKILSRITPPTGGEARLYGRVGALLEAGTGFHPELSGRENVLFSGTILGLSRAEIMGCFDAIVADAQVDEFLDTPVKRYSSGMKVRLAFAIATRLNADVLLFDEVLAVGDEAFQKQAVQRMRQTAARGCAILLVSHDLQLMRQVCHRLLWMEKGRLVMDAAADRVVSQYLASRDLAARGDAF